MANSLKRTGRTDAYSRCSDRQRLFVEAYIGEASGNAALAARIAGYSEKAAGVVGFEVLNNPNVRAAIEERYAANGVTADFIISRLYEQASAAHAGFIRKRSDGGAYVDMDGLLEAGLGRQIKKISDTKHGQTIEFYDAQAALVQLGKGLGLLRERVEVNVTGAKDEVAERLRATIARLEQALPAGDVVEAEFTVSEGA